MSSNWGGRREGAGSGGVRPGAGRPKTRAKFGKPGTLYEITLDGTRVWEFVQIEGDDTIHFRDAETKETIVIMRTE
jgi:hypothetical protein